MDKALYRIKLRLRAELDSFLLEVGEWRDGFIGLKKQERIVKVFVCSVSIIINAKRIPSCI